MVPMMRQVTALFAHKLVVDDAKGNERFRVVATHLRLGAPPLETALLVRVLSLVLRVLVDLLIELWYRVRLSLIGNLN